eukprot:6069870-Heterocapsa_arctica.AAC.1
MSIDLLTPRCATTWSAPQRSYKNLKIMDKTMDKEIGRQSDVLRSDPNVQTSRRRASWTSSRTTSRRRWRSKA